MYVCACVPQPPYVTEDAASTILMDFRSAGLRVISGSEVSCSSSRSYTCPQVIRAHIHTNTNMNECINAQARKSYPVLHTHIVGGVLQQLVRLLVGIEPGPPVVTPRTLLIQFAEIELYILGNYHCHNAVRRYPRKLTQSPRHLSYRQGTCRDKVSSSIVLLGRYLSILLYEYPY